MNKKHLLCTGDAFISEAIIYHVNNKPDWTASKVVTASDILDTAEGADIILAIGPVGIDALTPDVAFLLARNARPKIQRVLLCPYGFETDIELTMQMPKSIPTIFSEISALCSNRSEK